MRGPGRNGLKVLSLLDSGGSPLLSSTAFVETGGWHLTTSGEGGTLV